MRRLIPLSLIILVAMIAMRENRPVIASPQVAPQQVYTMFVSVTHGTRTNAKRGLAASTNICADYYDVGAVWSPAWVASPMICPGIENVPMIWSDYYATATVGGNSDTLLILNEPERRDQANTQPRDAAILYKQIDDLHRDMRLCSPATMFGLGQDATALGWLNAWRSEYVTLYGNAPRVDVLCFHLYTLMYDEAVTALNTVKALAQAWGVSEIWLTEFAFIQADSDVSCKDFHFEDVRNDAARFIRLLDADAMVRRYAWYTNRINFDWVGTYKNPPQCNAPLFDADGALNRWGEFYRGTIE